jgi:hypothetical protein
MGTIGGAGVEQDARVIAVYARTTSASSRSSIGSM